MKIIISRSDNLGDVILTLPLAGYLKSISKENQIFFIGKAYTKAIIETSTFIDQFLDKEEVLANPKILSEIQADVIIFVFPDKELAKMAHKVNIPIRIGTSHRIFHWFYCNKRVDFSRKKSDLHESQLNFKLLKPLNLETNPSLTQIPNWYGMKSLELEENFGLDASGFKLILHPKSKGSAREWSMENYFELAQSLNTDTFQIIITGTAKEGELIKTEKPEIFDLPHVLDLTGKLSLAELVSLIDKVDGLLACSTGPLHIASALGKFALGIYPPIKPMHPTRWKPVGAGAKHLVLEKKCEDCRKTENCTCINQITVAQVKEEILAFEK